MPASHSLSHLCLLKLNVNTPQRLLDDNMYAHTKTATNMHAHSSRPTEKLGIGLFLMISEDFGL